MYSTYTLDPFIITVSKPFPHVVFNLTASPNLFVALRLFSSLLSSERQLLHKCCSLLPPLENFPSAGCVALPLLDSL